MKKALVLTIALAFFALPCLSQMTKEGVFTMSLPAIDWALQIDLKGFQFKGMELQPDCKGQQMAAFNEKSGTIISAFLEKADHPGNAAECRKFYWEKAKKSPSVKSDVALNDIAGVPVVRYLIKEYEGQKIDQGNLNAYYSKGGYWIDIHMSKVKFTENDMALFKEILASVKFIEKYKPTRTDCFRYGSKFFLAQDYKNAITWYQRFYDMEQAERQADIAFWRVAVDNLGMSYGITGNVRKSREIYDAAIAKDPEYPSFYYNLACGYAEEENFDKAMVNLEKAIKFQDNLIAGDAFPDPMKDSSFKKYVNNEKFKNIVKKIKKKESPVSSEKPKS